MRAIDADDFGNRMYHEVFEKDTDMQKWDSGCWVRYKLFENVLREQPTIESRCETCEAFNKTRLLISQPQQRWIPCSKELPERNRVVLVTTKWDEVTEGVKLSGNAWFIGRGEENAFDSDIIAWMPKPEPYAERRTDDSN